MLKDSRGKEIVDDDGQTDVSPVNDSQEVLKFIHKMATK